MIPIFIGVFLLSLSGVFFNQVVKIRQDVKGVSTQVEVESTTDSEPSASPQTSESPKASETSDNSANVTIKNGSVKTDVVIKNNVNSDSSTNNSNKSNVSLALDDFKYSGASITSQSNHSLELTSSDDPDKITDWYKEKIRSLGFNSKSFVTTKSNDNVENKLVGSNGDLEIAVEIKKAAGSGIAVIKVNSDSD